MNASARPEDDDMPSEIEFSGATRGKFYRTDVRLNLPVYLDAEVQTHLAALAAAKGVSMSDLANELLKQDIAVLETASEGPHVRRRGE